ncbi:hypothetical protein, partial [Actinoallomurus iriomotensis]|uniref:MmyB family transcriptional regulator n=1 Tax=Actinoallomurus iriomotensis TaxID=478107 RepID=UPI002556E427
MRRRWERFAREMVGDQRVHERSRGAERFRHETAGTLTVAYDMPTALDGSGRRLFVLTPSDEPCERVLRALVTAHAGALGAVVWHRDAGQSVTAGRTGWDAGSLAWMARLTRDCSRNRSPSVSRWTWTQPVSAK